MLLPQMTVPINRPLLTPVCANVFAIPNIKFSLNYYRWTKFIATSMRVHQSNGRLLGEVPRYFEPKRGPSFPLLRK